MPAVSRYRRLAAAAVACGLTLLPPAVRGEEGAAPSQGAPAAGISSGLTAELMYRLLLGDVALQRGEPALAARAYLEAARETRDPALARRAAEVAAAARARTLTLEAARLWTEIDPAAARPKQLVAALANGAGGKGFDAAGIGNELVKAELERALAEQAASPAALAETFLQLNRLLSQESDRLATYRLVEAVARPYPDLPEARYAVALAALNAGTADPALPATALREVERALALRPAWERAAVLKADIVAKRSPAAATEYLADFVKANPDAKSAAVSLAQLYVEQKRYADARALFERLWAADKGNRDYQLAVGALAIEMKDWPAAESIFQDLKDAGYDDAGTAEFHLARIAEETQRYGLAYDRYLAVPEGERAWIAKLRAAAMLAKQGRVADARKFLADLPAVTIEQRVQVRQTEAQILRDAGDNAAAYAVLTQGLSEHPDQPDLLYDSAMVAEKLDKIDVVEARLARLIELEPDNAQALNALGYTLVDRTTRIADGAALIERAHKLAPTDPFILDSMGWAQFRMGRLDEAEAWLRRALAERQDPEIAAHLGEVLWAKGERGRARDVWQSQLQATPDNPVLLETMRRLAQ